MFFFKFSETGSLIYTFLEFAVRTSLRVRKNDPILFQFDHLGQRYVAGRIQSIVSHGKVG